MAKKSFAPTEAQEQIWLFEWISYASVEIPALRLAFHPANGELRAVGTAGRLKAMGVKAGVPDIIIPARMGRHSGLAIELKRADHSNNASPEQRWWLAELAGQGWRAEVCYGWHAAAAVVLDYFAIPRSEWARLGAGEAGR